MSYSDNTETILTISQNIAERLNGLYLPIRENEREVKTDAVTDAMVSDWQQLETDVERLVDEVDVAWTLPTSEEDYVDNNE